MSKEFIQKLAQIQRELNAPKSQYNSFGKYSYRSCEDILEGVKPLLGDLFLSISDEIVQIGERFYVKATATITDGESSRSASAMAREALTKKGMDDAQVTGATSSYARKYCLNGLFGIDDAKDADTDEHKKQQNSVPESKIEPTPPPAPEKILASFKVAVGSKSTMKDLKNAFAKAWSMLDGTKEQAMAQDIYEIRKSELELSE